VNVKDQRDLNVKDQRNVNKEDPESSQLTAATRLRREVKRQVVAQSLSSSHVADKQLDMAKNRHERENTAAVATAVGVADISGSKASAEKKGLTFADEDQGEQGDEEEDEEEEFVDEDVDDATKMARKADYDYMFGQNVGGFEDMGVADEAALQAETAEASRAAIDFSSLGKRSMTAEEKADDLEMSKQLVNVLIEQVLTQLTISL